ncbi:MAG: hypothetical protein VYD64_03670 [Pseudomonadota bacterium]|nr:hypothetical protein [Pseudomonadota bacterium]
MTTLHMPHAPFGASTRPFLDRLRKPVRRDDPADHAEILEKHDDRLIRDIGRTREDILGPEQAFWTEWRRIKAPWQL